MRPELGGAFASCLLPAACRPVHVFTSPEFDHLAFLYWVYTRTWSMLETGAMLDLPNAGQNSRRVSPDVGGFEWWYVQLVAKTFIGTIVLHTTPMAGGQACEPFLSVFLQSSSGLRIERKVSLEHATVSIDSAGIFISASDKIFSVEGLISHPSRPLRADTCEVVSRSDGLLTHWEIPVPRGAWEGSVLLETEVHGATALAYQDHNWGLGKLADYYRAWAWSAKMSPLGFAIRADVVGAVRGQVFRYSQGRQDLSTQTAVVKRRLYEDESATIDYARSMQWNPLDPAGGFEERVLLRTPETKSQSLPARRSR